mmetsp:Transcript_12756/g.34509  ORF Transcript_12756/g.34509 Transcript_12756/m.34509 type:complete len:287 (+) Transcript_12756:97-957(+)
MLENAAPGGAILAEECEGQGVPGDSSLLVVRRLRVRPRDRQAAAIGRLGPLGVALEEVGTAILPRIVAAVQEDLLMEIAHRAVVDELDAILVDLEVPAWPARRHRQPSLEGSEAGIRQELLQAEGGGALPMSCERRGDTTIDLGLLEHNLRNLSALLDRFRRLSGSLDGGGGLGEHGALGHDARLVGLDGLRLPRRLLPELDRQLRGRGLDLVHLPVLGRQQRRVLTKLLVLTQLHIEILALLLGHRVLRQSQGPHPGEALGAIGVGRCGPALLQPSGDVVELRTQ